MPVRSEDLRHNATAELALPPGGLQARWGPEIGSGRNKQARRSPPRSEP